MKKTLVCCLLLSALASLWAEKPRRYVEFGVDADVGVANNYLGLFDVFNRERTIVIDFLRLAESGLQIGATAEAEAFLNINFSEKFGLGFFGGVEVAQYEDVSKELFKLLTATDAGSQNIESVMSAGASAFVNAGLRTSFKFGKLSLGFSPAAYVPLMYIPPPQVSAHVDTGSGVKAEANVDATVYMGLPPDTLFSLLSDNGFHLSSGDIWNTLEGWGLDTSFDAEYACNPRWDLGASVAHIPLYPARLRYGAQIRYNYPLDFDVDELLEDLLNGRFDLSLPELTDPVFYDNLAFRVFRPLRFDFYAAWKPFSTKLIVLKPDIGFSALTVHGYEADKMCFNAGLEAQLNLKRIFSLSLATGYREKIWRHGLGLMLNLRVLQIDLAVALQSPDFVGSFKIQGAQAAVGLRFGY
ncbi:MAG: hypothetical protein LBK27_01220 [Treponema sp.]|jgi:hypothetical protein|nr:hypothetical protein [Treponema sp.]